MADFVYTQAIGKFIKGDLDLDVADIRFLLLKSSAVVNKDHDLVSEVIAGAAEISVAGYSRFTITGEAVTIDDTNDLVKFTATGPVTFGVMAAGQTFQYLIMYAFISSDAASIPICCYDVGALATNGTEFQFNMNVGGFLRAVSA